MWLIEAPKKKYGERSSNVYVKYNEESETAEENGGEEK